MNLTMYRKIKYRQALPYRKILGNLSDYRVNLESKSEEEEILKDEYKITTEHKELILYEKRNGEYKATSIFSTKKHNMWGETSYPLLEDLLTPLNNKSAYDWETIERILLDFLKKTGKYGSCDFTLGGLASFIGNVMRAKYELTKTDFDKYLISDDTYLKTIRSYVFSQLKIYSEISKIAASEPVAEEKGRKIVQTIISNHDSFNLPKFTLFDPFYHDDSTPPYGIELDELYAMERKYEKEKKKIEAGYSTDKGKQRILLEELLETDYFKRIDACESRRVMGGTLTFSQQEDRIREEARGIASALLDLLLTWGINDTVLARKCISVYWDIFEERAWERQQKEIELEKLRNKWKSDIQEIRNIQTGQWDSNTITLLGILIAIFLSIFFGLLGIFNISWILSLKIASLFLIVWITIFKISASRKFLIKYMSKLLRTNKA